ncbi:hypothetical protein LTS00_000067 [Friedmanniomyces endolithicus]|nr:hypothetical protein LTS00_000067 [Friedmanniomyces endolithicus]
MVQGSRSWITAMEQQRTSRCGSTATLCESPSSSTSSTTSLKQHIDIPRRVSDALDARGFDVSSEGLVTFQDSSRSHPRNWSLLRKSYDAGLICFLEFWMTLVSNTGSATSEAARDELGISREMGVFCFVTVYMLGQALGGLVLPPMAESFGGRTIYVVTTLLFGGCCLIIALVPTLPTIVACRALSGMLSAVPAVVAAGSLENMFDARGRIYLIHLWISGAVLGLALAPPFATYVSASSLRWPAVYAITAIVTFACTLLCLLVEESRPSQVLHQQVRKVSKQAGFDQLSADGATLPTVSDYAASANAPMAYLRAILSGVFPLIGRRMFSKLGNNNALFLLAALATCFCGVAVWFAFQGKQLRQRSPFASESSESYEHRSETYLAEKSGRV